MRSFSIRSLTAFIVLAAIGLAALRDANDLWAGMLLLLALATVAVAMMGAVISRWGAVLVGWLRVLRRRLSGHSCWPLAE